MPPTPLQILSHTPAWVFAVLAVVLWIGGRQAVPHRLTRMRAAVLPLAMGGLSLAGAVSASGDRPLALACWAAGAAVAAAATLRRPLPAGARYDAGDRRFHLPGSAVPLVLMLGLFTTKYAVGVALALHPGLAHAAAGSAAIGAAYGAFSGAFAARALRLRRPPRPSRRPPPVPTTPARTG